MTDVSARKHYYKLKSFSVIVVKVLVLYFAEEANGKPRYEEVVFDKECYKRTLLAKREIRTSCEEEHYRRIRNAFILLPIHGPGELLILSYYI